MMEDILEPSESVSQPGYFQSVGGSISRVSFTNGDFGINIDMSTAVSRYYGTVNKNFCLGGAYYKSPPVRSQ